MVVTAEKRKAFGRRTSVLDENGHRISFGWNRFGLSSRTTAENQLTDYVRDDDGLVTEILSKQNGRTDRSIRNEYDEFGRLTYADYGNGEIERFAYDKWNRLAKHTRGKTEETYKYDHFGRLVEKKESGLTTSYTYDVWGNRLSRVTKNRKGEVVSKENRAYDRFGRLAETAAGFGAKVTYAYDSRGRLARQVVDGSTIEYEYTKYGQLAGKHLGGKLNPDASVTYEYSKSGQIVARTANGVRQTYEYDKKGQLLAVKDADGNDVERYVYDRAGNMTKKTVGGKTTTFTFDDANQLVSSTTDGITTRYEYDAAGRLVREGNRTYTYGYLDKVMSVRFDRSSANSSTSQPLNSSTVYTYTYHPDGQLASANYGDSSEDFTWDGLALIQRGNEHFINEPHVGGGNPVASSKDTTYFNDMLGTTVGAKKGSKYSAAALTAFGEHLNVNAADDSSHSPFPVPHSRFFTGKPEVPGLGYAFLMRNYRAGLAKWQTADPLGYPDGWNALAYCNNGVTSAVDLWGCTEWELVERWDSGLISSKWIEIDRTAPSADDVLSALIRYGDFGWIKPQMVKGTVEKVGDTEVSGGELKSFGVYAWWEICSQDVFQRVDTLQCVVTTRDLQDNPSLLHALSQLGVTLGSKVPGMVGETISVSSDVTSICDAFAEIGKCSEMYGKDTEWTIVFGTVTSQMTKSRVVGAMYIME